MTRVSFLSSVHVGVLRSLTALLEERLGFGVTVVSSLADADWRSRRGRGGLTSLLARLRGLLFPVLVALPRKRDAGVLVATTNPFWLPLAVALRRPRAPLITLVYDVYPDALEARWNVPRILRWAVGRIVASGLRRSSAVVVLGERIGQRITARWSLTTPVTVIPTGADPSTFTTVHTQPVDLENIRPDHVVMTYVGNTGSMHDGRTLGCALARVLDAFPDEAFAVVATRGDRAEELLAPLRRTANARLETDVDDSTWTWLLARSDVALVTLDARAGIASMPSKVYPALAAGCALLAIAPTPSDLADLIRSNGAGLVVDPGDVDAAVQSLTRLVTDAALRTKLGDAARAAAEQYAPAALAAAWADVLAPLLDPVPPRSSDRSQHDRR